MLECEQLRQGVTHGVQIQAGQGSFQAVTSLHDRRELAVGMERYFCGELRVDLSKKHDNGEFCELTSTSVPLRSQ